MAEIPVRTLIPSSGAVPSNGYDSTSQAGYTRWELDDEARFSVVVPDNYVTGSDFSLAVQESSSSAEARHQWRITTLLLRPGVHSTDEQTAVEVFTEECESSSSSDQLSTLVFQVTGSGQVGYVSDVAISQGDALSFVIERIAASANEDPNAIKVFNLTLSTAVDEAGVSNCAGRVGKIIDTVRDLFNESTGGFLADEFILRSINRCQQDLAQEDYWRRETWIPAVSGGNESNLLDLLSDYQDIHQVHFSGADHPMTALPGFQQYQELKTGSNATGVPECYVVQNDRMYVWPPPESDLQSGYCVYHSYLPGDLTCSASNPDPRIPKAHDMVFVYFTLKQAFLRDRHAPGAEIKSQEYTRLYEHAKQRLLGEGDPPGLALRSYR